MICVQTAIACFRMAGGEDVGKPQILHWTRGVIEAAGTAVGPVRPKVTQDIDIFVLECVVVSVLPFQITFLTSCDGFSSVLQSPPMWSSIIFALKTTYQHSKGGSGKGGDE